eukprot:symbB.v1.2.014860.t1/scaffold1095.1/size138309/8
MSKPATMKAVSYGPVPLKKAGAGAGLLAQDDWMVEAAKPMWGLRGRDDLGIISQLGANTIRLYGNNPNESHKSFLDEAHEQGLKVVPGMSDFPYTQMVPGPCIQTHYDCFNQSRDSYALNLQTGFLTEFQEYHPALSYFILINEPDLKMPSTTTTEPGGPKHMARAVVSAFDGLLEAEKLANVTGELINITATFSYAVCIVCDEFSHLPALGQIATLVDAMLNPESYGYEPKNNITEAFLNRWVHSFNTNNPARDLKAQFFDHYPDTFGNTPVFVAEYHSVILQYLGITLEEDLALVMDLVSSSEVFFGISFFQYQVAYWKGGSEMDFGLFGLGNYLIAEMPYYGQKFSVWCLEPQVSHSTPGASLPQVLTKAFEGPAAARSLDYEFLCQPNPHVVPLSADGFGAIASQGAQRFAIFVKRVVEHLGAEVVDESGLESFAAQFLSGKTWGELVTAISYAPSWTSFSSNAACVADRTADAQQVGAAISWLCGQTLPPGLSCEVPKSCTEDAFTTADWLFSRWYRKQNQPDPLQDCNFGGAGIFASPAVRSFSACVARARQLRGSGEI